MDKIFEIVFLKFGQISCFIHIPEYYKQFCKNRQPVICLAYDLECLSFFLTEMDLQLSLELKNS